jgi:arginyl-tRNA synthetase
MNTVVQLSLLCGLLLSLIGIGTVIYKVGRTEQKLTSKIEELEASKVENRQMIGKVLDELTAHCKDETLHVNAKLEERMYHEQSAWRGKVDEKLELLIRNNKG